MDLKALFTQYKVLPESELAALFADVQKHKKTATEILLENYSQKMDEKALFSLFVKEYGFVGVNPEIFVPDNEILKLIPGRMAKQYCVLPLSRFEKTLSVAFANPLNVHAIDEIREMTGLRLKVSAAKISSLQRAIAKYYADDVSSENLKTTDSVELVTEKMEDVLKRLEGQKPADGTAGDGEGASRVHYETPVIRLVNTLLIEAVRRHASDIFIEPWESEIRVRVRVDGLLEEIARPQKSLASSLVSRIKIMSHLDIAEHRLPQDGRFKARIHEREVDMRVSILPTTHGEKVCMRILDSSGQAHDISKLGFTADDQKILEDCAKKPHGMILVTGPTGSGKTTTLYSILNYLDKPDSNITTVEDPVEYQLSGINQVNVREAIGMTFPAALRSILRQDPDIILIGEIRDRETMDISIKAALTGHLVLSTLHTNDAASSVTRMVNMGLEPFLISSTVLMISAQRLIRRLCSRCRISTKFPKSVLLELGLDPSKKYEFFQPKGCVQCRHCGYKGRTVITELMPIRGKIQELICQNASADALRKEAQSKGMKTLRESALQKAFTGETSIDEVFRVTGGGKTSADDSVEEEVAA